MSGNDDRTRVGRRRLDHNRLRYSYYVMTEHARTDRRLSIEAAVIGMLFGICEPVGPHLERSPRGSGASPLRYGTSR